MKKFGLAATTLALLGACSLVQIPVGDQNVPLAGTGSSALSATVAADGTVSAQKGGILIASNASLPSFGQVGNIGGATLTGNLSLSSSTAPAGGALRSAATDTYKLQVSHVKLQVAFYKSTDAEPAACNVDVIADISATADGSYDSTTNTITVSGYSYMASSQDIENIRALANTYLAKVRDTTPTNQWAIKTCVSGNVQYSKNNGAFQVWTGSTFSLENLNLLITGVNATV